MTMPTDRGYVVVTDEADGTQTVQVAASIAEGKPVGVYAVHKRVPPPVVIHPEVELVADGPGRFSRDVVQVFADRHGSVHVAAVS
jgi:hypothetical protein